MAAKFGGSLKCTVCAKSVYPQEKVAIEKVTVHKTCFKCSTCNTTLTVGNYHVVEDKLLCKNHYQQSFAHKAPSADVPKTTTPRGTAAPSTSAVDTKKQEEEKRQAEEKKKQEQARVEAEKKKQEEEKKKQEQARVEAEKKQQQAAKPAVTPVNTKPAVTATPAAKPAVTPVNTKPAADDSKALDSLKQFSAALDKLEHALTAVERRL
eukprot:TRINITY_DN213_c0_g1_i1.p1 TRINITY_DN213_c0_g1~~TRINITY_DN213_c0_g1_i1.p1  ORF type:complete len:208 (+),score=115.12 TRINITY_DN213_c0_g1_i1:50-673(+)